VSSAEFVPDRRDAQQEPWPQYASAVVELLLDGRHIVLTPHHVPPDRSPDVDGAVGCDGGEQLRARRPPIWVLTAGDPYPVELSSQENEARLLRLCTELDAADIEHDPALGRSADGSTSEVSRALRGIDRSQACAIAARHDQLAVYEIDSAIRCVHVASGEVVTTRAFVMTQRELGSVGPKVLDGWARTPSPRTPSSALLDRTSERAPEAPGEG